MANFKTERNREAVASLVAGSSGKGATANDILDRIRQACEIKTNTQLAEVLGISQTSVSKAKTKGHIPSDWIVAISHKYGISADWILYGTGPKKLSMRDNDDLAKSQEVGREDKDIRALMDENRDLLKENKQLLHDKNKLLGDLIEKAIDPERDFVVPVVGLAECSLPGWEQISKKGLHAVAPVDIWKIKNSFGVIASSDSMSPAGIEPGHLVFCNTKMDPEPGDAVYIEQDDNHATIKLYLGETGKRDTLMLRLQGWQPKNEKRPGEHPKPFTMEMPKSAVKLLATVVYVKRRF